jgi:hypothetical protein
MLIQYGLQRLVVAPARGYFLYLPPFLGLVIFLSTVVPVTTIVAVVVTYILSARAANPFKMAIALGYGLLLPFLCFWSSLSWWTIVWGGGSGTTVAEVPNNSNVYRLDYSVAGDPPTSCYRLLQCESTGWFCKEIGNILPNKIGGYADVAPAQLLLAKEVVTIVIDDITVAQYESGQLKCAPLGGFICTQR